MKYKHMVICDLRHLNNAEVIREIEEIKDIVLLILPKDADDTVKNAFGKVKQKRIVSTVYVGKDAEVGTINGEAIINPPAKEKIYIVNGKAYVAPLGGKKIKVVVNGEMIACEKDLEEGNIEIISVNGKARYDDYDRIVDIGENTSVDSEIFLEGKPLVVTKGLTFVPKLPENACGIIAGSCVANSDIKKSNVRTTGGVIYTDCADILVRDFGEKIKIDREMLSLVDGKMAVKAQKVEISHSVTDEELLNKVVAIKCSKLETHSKNRAAASLIKL